VLAVALGYLAGYCLGAYQGIEQRMAYVSTGALR
jgi:hypothetical protein